jgi:phosphoglycerol transferase
MFFLLLVGFALFLGILDQTGPSFIPDYVRTKSEYINDAEFVDQIQTAVPAGAMIFQLPYVQFPESPEIYGMRDYELFRGYLHSRTLRWSYGAMKNREDDVWQRKVAGLPIGEFVQTLGFAGFSGIYLDRYGYEDKGLAILKDLSNALEVKPLTSRDGRLVFFNMTDYDKRLREKYSEVDWRRKEDLSLHPLVK